MMDTALEFRGAELESFPNRSFSGFRLASPAAFLRELLARLRPELD